MVRELQLCSWLNLFKARSSWIALVLGWSLANACTRPVDSGASSNLDSEGSQAEHPSTSGSQEPSAGEDSEFPETTGPDSQQSENNNGTCRGKSLHCAAAIPHGWIGPLQLQKMDQAKSALECDPILPDPTLAKTQLQAAQDSGLEPSFDNNLFVDTIKGPEARCSGCKATFRDGICLPPRWSLRKLDSKSPSGCGEKEIKDWGSSIRVGECHAYNLQSQSGEGWALMPPKIETKGECSAEKKDVVEELDPVRFGTFYRSCKIERDTRSCGDEDDICLRAKTESPWMNRVCIAKRGQHKCESSDYPLSIVTFAGYVDQRGCTPCTATKTDDKEHCEGNVYVQFKDENECQDLKAADPNKICVENFRFEQLQPTTSTRDEVKYVFRGKCIANPMKPRGTVKPIAPLTFCCQAGQ